VNGRSLTYLADGASTQRIAERLVLEQTTVYSLVKSVLRKLGVHSRRDAVVAAERLRREEALARRDLQARASKFSRGRCRSQLAWVNLQGPRLAAASDHGSMRAPEPTAPTMLLQERTN
jgi:DNA-binding CsgD family transcriptional regulator